MCGLFGVHKKHKITTKEELKDLNKEMIEANRNWVVKMGDFDNLKKSNDFVEFLKEKIKPVMQENKKKALNVYKEAKKVLKDFIYSFIVENETKVSEYIESNIKKEGFSDFKNGCYLIEQQLNVIEKENSNSNENLFNTFNSLKQIENDLENLEICTKQSKGLIKTIKKAQMDCNYDKISLLNSINLKMSLSDHKKEFLYEENMLLLETISQHESHKELDFVDENEVSEKEEEKEELNLRNSSISNMTSKKSVCSLKNSISKPLLVKNLYSNIKKGEKKERFGRRYTEIIPENSINIMETRKNTLTLRNTSSLQYLSFEGSDIGLYKEKKLDKFNLYTTRNAEGKKKKEGLKRLNTRDLSPSSLTYELSDKNSTIQINNKNLDEIDLHRILIDAFKKKKVVTRINFRDNMFDFDVIAFLREHFNEKQKRLITVDLRRNRIKINNRNIQFMKKNLLLHNVKILI